MSLHGFVLGSLYICYGCYICVLLGLLKVCVGCLSSCSCLHFCVYRCLHCVPQNQSCPLTRNRKQEWTKESKNKQDTMWRGSTSTQSFPESNTRHILFPGVLGTSLKAPWLWGTSTSAAARFHILFCHFFHEIQSFRLLQNRITELFSKELLWHIDTDITGIETYCVGSWWPCSSCARKHSLTPKTTKEPFLN